MIIQRKHPMTGKLNSLDLNVTEAQYRHYCNGTKVQDAFPYLSADECEFLISGLLPGEFDDLFYEEEI